MSAEDWPQPPQGRSGGSHPAPGPQGAAGVHSFLLPASPPPCVVVTITAPLQRG